MESIRILSYFDLYSYIAFFFTLIKAYKYN